MEDAAVRLARRIGIVGLVGLGAIGLLGAMPADSPAKTPRGRITRTHRPTVTARGRKMRAHPKPAAAASAGRTIAAAQADALAAQAGAPAAADSSRRAWTEARGLADDGHYPEGLAVVRRALRHDPDNVDLRWLEAGITGWSGRHAESVLLYDRLVEDHPELARDVRSDLATERLKAGDTQGALRDLDLRIADEPADREARSMRALALSWADRFNESLGAYDALLAETPDDADIMIERARVLAWMGRNHDAAAAYHAVLQRQPENRRAQLGLAMNENWQGLHQRAAIELEGMTADPQADPETYKALAFARYWNGEPTRARQALDAYLTRKPEDREALDLKHQLDRDGGTSLTAIHGRSDDTDELRVESTGMELRLPLPAQTTATLGWQRDNVRDNVGTRDPLQLRVGFETIWNAQWTTRESFSHCDFGDSAGTAGLGELGVAWRPGDLARFDLGVSRDLVTTRLALAKGVSARTWVGGADWRVSEPLTLRASERLRFYSDDNRSQRETASAAWEIHSDRRGSFGATLGVEQLRTRLDLDNGYYDPRQYLEWGPGFNAKWTPREDFRASGSGQFGWQRERGAKTDPFFNVSGRVEWTLQQLLTLALEGGRSNSNLTSATGYEQGRWAISATRGF